MKQISQKDIAGTEELIRTIMQESEACGLAACIIDAEGNTVYENYFGTRDGIRPVEGDTIFGLASVTKSFTALSILQMQEEGILSVDDPLSKYIPEFTNRNTDTVKLSHLLSHSGGFFPQTRIVVEKTAADLGLKEDAGHDLAYSEELAVEGGKLVAERLDSLTKENGLIAAPGKYCSYCNDGFGLLSEIIRRYGDQPSYAEYVREHILKPLGMERSFCDFIRPAQDDNAAVLYDRKDGVMIHHRNYHDDAFVLNGGGAMKSTLNDLKRYLSMYLDHGADILSSESIDEIIKPRIPFGLDEEYCYGLYTGTYGNCRIYQHGGSLPGVSSNILFSCDAGCAVIVLCNTSDVPVSAISDALFAAYTAQPWPLPNKRQKTEWTDAQKEDVKGHYASGEGTEFDVSGKNGTLILTDENGKEKEIIPIADDLAYIQNKYSETVFEPIRDEKRGVFAVRYGSRIIPKTNKEDQC